jgi:hypothetical protein
MKETFINKRFSEKSLGTIEDANTILEEYAKLDFTLTLRQLYYQMVSRGLIPNNIKSYKRFGSIVSDARLAGMIDWEMIEDRGRVTNKPPFWGSPADIIESAARSFAIDMWMFQDNYVEVMCEKDALTGVLLPVCQRLRVSFTANRGYSSSSAMYEAGKRMARMVNRGKTVYLFYLGDHDPSGIDMTRDIEDRTGLFSDCNDGEIVIERLALNMDQVREFDPPENPAKETDSRCSGYIAKFGSSSWELDAINPTDLEDIVENAIEGVKDDDQWEIDLERERKMIGDLKTLAKEYRSSHP